MLKRTNKGFSLIEVLLVISVIGILATMAVPQFFNSLGKGKDAERLTNVRNMSRVVLLRANAIDNYTYAYNRSGLQSIMDVQNVDLPSSGPLGCYVFGVSNDATDFFFAIESDATPNTFIVDGSINGKVDFEYDFGLQAEMSICSPLTDPTIDENYWVFYL